MRPDENFVTKVEPDSAPKLHSNTEWGTVDNVRNISVNKFVVLTKNHLDNLDNPEAEKPVDNLINTAPEDFKEQPGESLPQTPIENATKSNPQKDREPLKRTLEQLRYFQ